jgi:hypothetical protein
MVAWSGTLTKLIADGTALPLAAAVEAGRSVSSAGNAARLGLNPQQQQQQQQQRIASDHFSAAAAASTTGTALAGSSSSSSSAADDSGGTLQHKWHPNMSGAAAAAGTAQLGQQRSSSRDWVSCTGQLQQLQLCGLLVDNAIRCKSHGSSDCSCEVSETPNTFHSVT